MTKKEREGLHHAILFIFECNVHCLGFWVCFISLSFHIWTTVYFNLFILVWARAAGMFNAVEYIAEGDQVVA